MIDQIAFTIPGQPVAKGRARFARRGNFVTTYTPEKTARYENLVKLAAQAAMELAAHASTYSQIEGPVELRVLAYYSIPTSWSMKKQRSAALGEIIPIVKPDLDNVIKAIKDGCNKVVWKDDSQVANLISTKRYGEPRVDVRISRIA